MATLSIKVHLCSQQTVKTIQFSAAATVHEACGEIRAKLGDAVGGDDHALFWPAHAKWLVPTKSLAFYEIASGDTLEFKKKHRMLRVRLLDETVKTVLIDDSLPVLLLVQSVCGKIGIANPEEYSFALDASLDVLGRPGTVSRDHGRKRASLESADHVNWLNPEKSLPEQGVDETATLLLKKKFFYSDQSIDRNDPIQLHLVYQQSRDGIVSGKHPCTLDEAVQFAALQAQIVHGNYDEAKHKVGFLNLRECLPEEYRKTKDVERRIFNEHRKLAGMPELTVKHRYVQLCRSLKTYGVTFFLVKEKDAKRGKMVARLIGITKDSILRCDAESKEVLQTWPLTSLRRWAASPSAFTMDFGDYQDAFYSVQTTQGEQMSQLIAGYIDIIIKRKKEADRVINTGTEEVITTEEVLRPARAQAIAIKPAQLNTAQEIALSQQGELAAEGAAGSVAVHRATSPMAQQASVSVIAPVTANVHNPPPPPVDPAKHAVITRVQAGLAAATALTADMTVVQAMPLSLPTTHPAPELTAQTLFAQTTALAHLASHLAATTALVQATLAGDAPAMAHQVAALTSNLAFLGSVAKSLHSAGRGDGALPETARELATATAKLLAAVQDGVTVAVHRETLLASAQNVTNAAGSILAKFSFPAPAYAPATQRRVMDAAKAVSVATQELVNKAKRVAGEMGSKDDQMRLIEQVKASAGHASTVAVTAAIVAPLAASSLCWVQLQESAGRMRGSVDAMVSHSQVAVPASPNLAPLVASAGAVVAALEALITCARTAGSLPAVPGSPAADDANGGAPSAETMAAQSDRVRAGCAAVTAAIGNPAAIVAAVKSLTMSSTELVTLLKRQHAATPAAAPGTPSALLDAAKALAEATTRMVTAAKESARDPAEPGKQASLLSAVDAILGATDAIASAQASAAAVPTLTAAAHSLTISGLVLACDPAVIGAPTLAPLAKRVLEAARNHTVSHTTGAAPLVKSARGLADAVQALLKAAAGVPEAAAAPASQVCARDVFEVQGAVTAAAVVANTAEVAAVVQGLTTLRHTSASAPAVAAAAPLDLAAVKAACKDLGTALASLVGSATQGKDLGETAPAVHRAAQAVVAATAAIPAEAVERALVAAVLDKSLALVHGVQSAPRDKALLADAVKSLNGSVVKLLEGAATVAAAPPPPPPVPSPVHSAVSATSSSTAAAVPAGMDTREVVVGASSAMVQAISQLVTAKAVPGGDLKRAAVDLEGAFRKLVVASKAVMTTAPDASAKAEILELVQAASAQCVELINVGNASTATSAAPGHREALGNAAASLGASVNRLLEKCAVVGNLSDVEVIRAMQALEMAATRLASPALPTKLGDLTFSECLGKVVDDSRQVAQIMSAAVKAPVDAAPEPASLAALCHIVASIADTAMFAAALLSPLPIGTLQPLITDLTRELHVLESAATQQAVLDAAAGVAAATNAVCGLLRTRAALVADANDELEHKHLVELATSLASASQHLIHTVKPLAVDPASAPARAAVAEKIPPVRAAADAVYAHSTAGAGAIRAGARNVVDAGRHVLGAAHPGATARRAMMGHGASLGHHLSSLVTTLRDAAPGQRELVTALDCVRAAVADLDEALLASAVEGPRVALVHDDHAVVAARHLAAVLAPWLPPNPPAALERDPARPAVVAGAFAALAAAVTDTAVFDAVKASGESLLVALEALKFGRPVDAAPAADAAADVAAALDLRNQLHTAATTSSGVVVEGVENPLDAVQAAARDLVGQLAKLKSRSALRVSGATPALVAHFTKLATAARAAEAHAADVVVRDRLRGAVARVATAVVGVVLNRVAVSALSTAIQGLVAGVQETVRAGTQCVAAAAAIEESLVPLLAVSGDEGEETAVVPGALQMRCNQVLESLHALVGATESGMDSVVGDAAEASIGLLRAVVVEARRGGDEERTRTLESVLVAWRDLVSTAGRAVTRGPGDPLMDSVHLLANQINKLVLSLTANHAQDEFNKISSSIEAALRMLPTAQAASELAASPTSAAPAEAERIVTGTKAVAATTFDMIKAAAVCQRELSSASPSTPTSAMYMDDGTWSEGLVSASRNVAGAMQDLIACAVAASPSDEAAIPRERVVACARAVASATVQVVAAASAKAPAHSPAFARLKTNAKAVVAAAESMVARIKATAEVDAAIGEDLLALKPATQTAARLQLLEAQTNVLAMEKELERARARLTEVKKARYSASTGEQAP
ncbi:hypothetical protein H9P43_002619 [Blastocladiella emersonii ATCC 22665]|nr:hypothetical protein H9P43_002619 [Blastocladiella emersonii ATCC 22665]